MWVERVHQTFSLFYKENINLFITLNRVPLLNFELFQLLNVIMLIQLQIIFVLGIFMSLKKQKKSF